MSGKILQCFLNVNMQNGHDGLADICKTNGIKVKEIEPGSYVVFINTARDKLKLYAAGQVLAYLRLEKGQKLNMQVIKELPRVFDGRQINYDLALKKVIEDMMAKKQKTVVAIRG
jgi:hypothetical protein